MLTENISAKLRPMQISLYVVTMPLSNITLCTFTTAATSASCTLLVVGPADGVDPIAVT